MLRNITERDLVGIALVGLGIVIDLKPTGTIELLVNAGVRAEVFSTVSIIFGAVIMSTPRQERLIDTLLMSPIVVYLLMTIVRVYQQGASGSIVVIWLYLMAVISFYIHLGKGKNSHD